MHRKTKTVRETSRMLGLTVVAAALAALGAAHSSSRWMATSISARCPA
jgi:hypothetical protein